MRLAWFKEHCCLVGTLLLVSFCCLDEEPLLDWSDLNLLHVWVLVGCVAVTYFDLSLRARYGQWVVKDQTSAFAAFSFAWGLETYVRLLLLVFCAHNLMPLELDLLELAELYQAWGAWLVSELLPSTLVLVGLLCLAALLNATLGSGSPALVLALVCLLCVGHLLAAGLLLWDLLTSGLSAQGAWEEAELFYPQPKTALTFDRALGAGDLFEWHRERAWPYALRFEDLYFFFFQLLLAWDLLCSLFFWCCLFATGARLGGRAVSYTQVGLGLVWLEHVCVSLAVAYVGFVIVGLRIMLRLPGELGSLWA